MQKYLLQQPNTLETLAIDRVADWITIQAEDLLSPIAKLQDRYPTKAEQLLSRKIQSMRNFVQDHMPNLCYNKLASELIKKIPKLLKKRNLLQSRQITNENVSEHIYVCDPIDAYNVVSRIIEITFTKNLTFLLIDDPESEVDFPFPVLEYNTWDIFKNSFCSKSHLLSGLVRLEIKSCSEEIAIIQLLKELHNLKYLSLSIATYNVLKCVVDNCKLIEQLEVDYKEEVTDHSIDILPRLRNLKHINLNATTVTKKGIAILLLCCKNIESIRVSARETLIENALKDLSIDAAYADKQFKLTYFSGTQKTTAEQLKLVVKMCPRLQTVQLTANETSRDILLPLHELTDLRYLTVFGFDFYGDGIRDLLEARGNSILYLYLTCVDEMDSNALTCILRTCPNLQSLNFRTCSFERENLHAASKLAEVRTAALQYLKKITLTMSASEPTDDQLVYLFSNCPNVEFVDICEEDLLTDEIMFQVVDGKNWMHLKELKLYKTGLSKYVIDLIVQNCAGQPEVIIYNAE